MIAMAISGTTRPAQPPSPRPADLDVGPGGPADPAARRGTGCVLVGLEQGQVAVALVVDAHQRHPGSSPVCGRSERRAHPPGRVLALLRSLGLRRMGVCVEPTLQDLHRGDLVDHRAARPRPHTICRENTHSRNRGEPFIGQHHRNRVDQGSQSVGERPWPTRHWRRARPDIVSGRPTTTPTAWCSSISAVEPGEIPAVLAVPGHGFDRHGEHAPRIRAGDAHPNGADVDAQPDPRATARRRGVGPSSVGC